MKNDLFLKKKLMTNCLFIISNENILKCLIMKGNSFPLTLTFQSRLLRLPSSQPNQGQPCTCFLHAHLNRERFSLKWDNITCYSTTYFSLLTVYHRLLYKSVAVALTHILTSTWYSTAWSYGNLFDYWVTLIFK